LRPTPVCTEAARLSRALRVAAAFTALAALRRLPASRAAALQLPMASAAAGVFRVSAAEASTAGEGFRAAAEPSAAGMAAVTAKRGPVHRRAIDHV
jgi:hypothetical protein